MFDKKKLWIAIENGQALEALSLIKNISDVNTPYLGIENENSQTFLLQALNRGQIDVAMALLDSGADASICDSKGNSSLYYFVKRGLYEHTYLAQCLIERGADINKRIGGYTLLSLSFLKMPQLVPFLLKRKADIFEAPFVDEQVRLDLFFPVDVVAYRDLPYLSMAILNDDEDSFNYLIRFSEIINMADSYGRTPLMISALKCDNRKAQLLINAGAFLDVKDFAGRTVQDYFRNMAEQKYQELLAVQREQNAISQLINLAVEAKSLSKDFDDLDEKKERKEGFSIWMKLKHFLGFK